MTVDAKLRVANGYNSAVDEFAFKSLDLRDKKPTGSRVLIGLSGIPGSGKTTFSDAIVSRVNDLYRKRHGSPESTPAVVVPMDGFHLYRTELAAMADPETAVHRRGAAFTFAAEEFHRLVKDLAEPTGEDAKSVYALSFDHAEKDPIERDIKIAPHASIVVIEGLYLGLYREPWASAAKLMDETWFVTVDGEVARSRLVQRHIESGTVPGMEEAVYRVSSTDLLNADDILENRLPAHETIEMLDRQFGKREPSPGRLVDDNDTVRELVLLSLSTISTIEPMGKYGSHIARPRWSGEY